MTTQYPRAADSADAAPLLDYNHIRTIDRDDSAARPRGPILRLFTQHNPFYFLSACCMLLGCFVLNDALDWSPMPQDNLLILILTLNVYEGALITLGLFLVSRGLVRDGVFLLVLESLFLADVGFLNSELFTSDVRLGLIVNAILFWLGAVKIGIVFAGLGLRLRSGLFVFAVVQLGVLFAVPGLFADVASRRYGDLPPFTIYGAWWAVGLVPVLYAVLVRTDGLGPVHLRVVRALLVLPLVSLGAHLCVANWVYGVTFELANVAPLLLGLTVLAGRYDPSVATLASRMRLQLTVPLAAIVAAMIGYSEELLVDPHGLALSPLRLTLAAAALVYLDGWWMHRHPYFLWCAALSFGAALVGPTVRSVASSASDFGSFLSEYLHGLAPKTPAQWGVVSVAASFVLLAIGAVFSLARGARRVREGDVS